MIHDSCYVYVRDLVFGLSGRHPDNHLQTGQLQLSQDEICSLSEILDNMIQIPSLKDEKFLAVWKKKLACPKPSQPILLELSDYRQIFELMEGLLPGEFFAATKLERFTIRWRKESYERGCQDISEYTKDPNTLIALQNVDFLLRTRFRIFAESTSTTSISANCALVLLLRIKQYLDEGHISIGGSAEGTIRVITTLMSADEDARIPIRPQEVTVLNQLYSHNTSNLEPRYEPADQQTPPSEYAKNLFQLELLATYWLEKMIEVTHKSLWEERLTNADNADLSSRMNYVHRKLGEYTFKPFIPKAALLEAFHRNILTKPQDPWFLKPEHAKCVEKLKPLEDSLHEWNNWAARLAYPLLDEFLVKEMAKLGATPKDILTNAVPKLVAMRKEQEKELLEDKTRMEKFCTSAVKREAESRKKNDELRSEIRTKERQLRDREEGLKIQEADFKALQRKNQKTLQKESKVSDAQLRIEQEKVADLEKRLHTSDDALQTLRLDYDSVSTDLQDLKLSDSANKAKISSENDQQGSIDKLKEDLERYRGLYQATRSNEEIIQGRIDKAVREKNKELSVLREELEASQKQSADKSTEYEAKLLADLATRDETIQDLSRANIGLRDTISTQDAEIMRLKESRAAAVKLLLD